MSPISQFSVFRVKVVNFCLVTPFVSSGAFSTLLSHFHIGPTAIWKNALAAGPPDLNPTLYGWFKNSDTGKLKPTGTPQSVLKLIKCGC